MDKPNTCILVTSILCTEGGKKRIRSAYECWHVKICVDFYLFTLQIRSATYTNQPPTNHFLIEFSQENKGNIGDEVESRLSDETERCLRLVG